MFHPRIRGVYRVRTGMLRWNKAVQEADSMYFPASRERSLCMNGAVH